MSSPITADERAALRETVATLNAACEVGDPTRPLLDERTTLALLVQVATQVPRLLDALDTAEAERDEARAELAVARQHQREASLTIRSVEGLRKERDDALAESDQTLARQRECLRSREEQVRRLRAEVTRLHALVADLRAATSPAWDEDTVTEVVAGILRDSPSGYAADRCACGWVYTGLDGDLDQHVATHILAVVRRHLPVRPGRETIARAILARYSSFDPLSAYGIADAVLDLLPGESRATVQAEALREFADTRGVNVGDDDDEWWRGYRQAQRECLHDASARADRLENGAERG
ncbi:hypothetical protein [Sanguibacter sp. HDW7]|uniref:hypothetical protein n=1 Tax=Sanguibacter sp. HDW7 TaxID=2714931 RepID=UPI00140CEF48|nr:hypothetical protein [Sanguibacter sp. HDW7]QIK82415.1 hypothetical protein G7063_01390 [Sanguibacter sp. HDW7]